MVVVVSLICFAVSAVIGITLAAMYQKGKLSLNAATAHGCFGAVGLILLLIAAISGKLSGLGVAALVIFVIAAIGGGVLFAGHLKKGSLLKPLVAVHGAAAIVGFLLLLFGSAG